MSLFHLLSSCVCGYHVYNDVWTALSGPVLQCEWGSGNRENPYAVAALKDGLTVGHVLHHILAAFAPCLFAAVAQQYERESAPLICHREVCNCLAFAPSVVLKIPSRRRNSAFAFVMCILPWKFVLLILQTSTDLQNL